MMAAGVAGSVNVSIGAVFASTFKAAFGSAERQLGKLGSTVTAVDSKLARVTGLKRAQEQAYAAETAFRATDAELRQMGQHLAGLGTITDKQAREFRALEKRTEAARAAMERARGDADKMERELREAGQSTSHLTQQQRDLERQLQTTTNRFQAMAKLSNSGVGAALGNVGSKLRSLGTEALVAGAGLGYFFKKNFVDVASEFERFQTILETTEGSAAGAKKAMSWISDFAATTPFDLAEVTESFVKLRAYGLDPTTGLLRTLGDTGAAMGKPVIQAVEAIADAVTGENERLKEFGVKGSKKGGQVTYEYTDKAGKQRTKTVDANNRAMIQSTLEAIWNEKYGGAMQKLSGTWAGMVSNLSDQWTRFTNNTMNAGLFEWMKGRLGGLLENINRMAESGELQRWAEVTGKKLTEFAEAAWKVGGAIVDGTKWLADFVGGWRNLGFVLLGLKLAPLAVALVGLTSALFTAGGALIAFAGGTSTVLAGLRLLGAFMLTNPIGIAMTAMGVAGFMLWKNWDAMKAGLITIWEQIKAAIAPIIEWIAQKIDWVLGKVAAASNVAGALSRGELGAAWDSAKQFVGAAGPAAPAPVAAVPTTGRPVQQSSTVNAPITINGATDPQATAKAVKAELERREREAQANRRGAMTDAMGY